MMRCPHCGKIISSKKKHKCLDRQAIRDIKPLKWRPGVRQ